MPVQLKTSDRDAKRLATLLAHQAANFQGGVQSFYRDLVRSTSVPEPWKLERAGGWTGDATFDARELISWALSKGRNPVAPDWTTLGSLLQTLLDWESVGLDEASVLVALTDVYGLCLNQSKRAELKLRYGVPQIAPAALAAVVDDGAEIDWRGPVDKLELQAFLKPEPPLLDVDFVSLGIQRATCVCRIEIPALDRNATGFLAGQGLVLTNHHVLRFTSSEDLDTNARNALLHFRQSDGEPQKIATFKLAADKPILAKSEKLDYVLLRVESDINDLMQNTKWITAAPLASHLPANGNGLNVLQHPAGASMKLAISSSGVTGIYESDGILQYVTNVAPGSSGAPCFDDDWNVVALHHGARSRAFGRVGEGILMESIRKEITAFLT